MNDRQQGWHSSGLQPPSQPTADPGSSSPHQPGPVGPPRPVADRQSHGTNTDPFALQHALHSARNQSRFEAPELQSGDQQKSMNWRPYLFGGLAVLLVGILAGVSYVTWFRPIAHDSSTDVLPSGENSAPVQIRSPHEIVTDYFQSLEDGNVERALEFGETGSNGRTTLITQDAYAVTRGLTPISEFQILTEDEAATELAVSYRLGNQKVETSVRLERRDNGEYRLARTTVPMRILVPNGDKLPLLVNGEPIEKDALYELVPGRYELTTGLPLLAYPETSSFTISSLATKDAVITATPQLTEAGRSALQEAAEQSLNDCVAQRSLSPEGCPFSVSANRPVVSSSINWTLLNSPWTSSRATLSPEDQSIAMMTVPLQLKLSLKYQDGTETQGQNFESTVQVRASLLGTADDLAVTWRS